MSNQATLVTNSAKLKIDMWISFELWCKHSLFELFKYTHFREVNEIYLDFDLTGELYPDLVRKHFDFVKPK